MKTTLIKGIFFLIACLLSSTLVQATPIYMKYDGIDGDVSGQVEVRNGKVTLKKLKPGTYNLTLIFTGKDAKTRQGASSAAQGHVKVFDGTASFHGGVRVAVGDVNGDGRADLATANTAPGSAAYGGGGGTGKVQMQDFHFTMRTTTGQVSQAAFGGSGHGAGKVTLQDFHFVVQRGAADVTAPLGSFQLNSPQGTSKQLFDVSFALQLE
jgi:hypothetical protein